MTPDLSTAARTATEGPVGSGSSSAVFQDHPAFRVRVDAPAGVVLPVGEFDVLARPPFTRAVAALGHRSDVTVDMAGVQFIDAAGLGALVVLRNDLAATGSTLRLAGTTDRVRRVLDLAGLGGLLGG